MRRRLFDPDGWLWKPLGHLGDLVILSLLWGVCCIPLVTIGASTTALYDTAVHVLRRKDDSLFSRFFHTFRRELLSGALSTLLWAAILFAGYFLWSRLSPAVPEGAGRLAVTIGMLLVFFFALCVLAWVFPLLSRFTFRTGALNATAVRVAFGHILRSAALALLMAAVVFLCIVFVFPVMVLPGAAALLSTFLIEPVFLSYEHQEEEASSSAR